jgi:hypothetical protein
VAWVRAPLNTSSAALSFASSSSTCFSDFFKAAVAEKQELIRRNSAWKDKKVLKIFLTRKF